MTDQNKTIVSAVPYHPFGEPSTGEGSEPYLYTGKEKDFSGLYYYGARYYDPEIGRFITRDQKSGGIGIPQTLNRYTYCINNPLRYIDINGNDYFDPDWADEWYEEDENDMGYSLKGIFYSLALFFFNSWSKGLLNFSVWREEHPDSDYWLSFTFVTAGSFGVTSAASLVGLGSIAVSGVGVIAAAVFAGIYFILMKESDFYRDLYCNDSQFTTLYKTAEAYAQLLAMGCDCEQEATDAWVEFYVYCLQKKHGDNWFIYCPSNITSTYPG